MQDPQSIDGSLLISVQHQKPSTLSAYGFLVSLDFLWLEITQNAICGTVLEKEAVCNSKLRDKAT
jgi:hypothetical protein